MNKLIKYLQFNEKENSIYVPNELFGDIKKGGLKGGSHVAFAYSYYYLMLWLYRYTKYGQMNIDVKMIKEILGYNPNNKDVNYIIKKNGVLDQLGYTLSTTDYPISWNFNKGDIEFVLLSDLENEMRQYVMNDKGRNYKIKVPVKGLYRTVESEEDNHLDGIYYDISETHLVPFTVFMDCMENSKLGCIGFYLYGFLKDKCQKHSEYNSSIERISGDTGISEKTCERYLNQLYIEGYIKCAEGECKFYEGKYKRKANTYMIREN